MALGFERKRRRTRRWFLLHEPAEVRSEEDGLWGSWHSGKVIACYQEGWHAIYDVRYDHIVVNNGSDHLVDRVRVSVRGDNINRANENKCNYRGHIRPLPPSFEFGEWDLPYGTCVDVYHMESWWEGVIFDHEDGSKQRRIFFPDLGDEMMISIDTIRITLDWNELTDTWHRRGTWLFLELIEEYEKEYYIPVSVKQLWYDLREREDFQMVGDWISSAKALWKTLVLEAICDNLKVVLGHLFQVIDFPDDMQKQSEYSELVNNVDMNPEADFVETCEIVSIENTLSGDLLFYPKSSVDQSTQNVHDMELSSLLPVDGSNMNCLPKSSKLCHDKAVCELPQGLSVLPSKSDGVSLINEEDCSGSNSDKTNVKKCSSMCSRRTGWLPVVPEIVPVVESCPEAVIQYAQKDCNRPQNDVIADVRKHLLHLKWKIEFMREKGMNRFRYISPNGNIYYSLHQVCLELNKSDMENLSLISHDKNCSYSSKGDSFSHLNEHALENQDPNCSPLAVVSSQLDLVYVKPENCPQSIVEWYEFRYEERLNSKKNKAVVDRMTLKARKHLAYLGWVFWYTLRRGKRELRYISPKGRCFTSLRAACKIVMGEITPEGNASSCRRIKKKNNKKRIMLKRVRSRKRMQQVVTPNPLHHNPRTVLSWLIDNNAILPREKVYYGSRKEMHPMKEGRITRDGIKCSCCSKVYTLSGFEAHAGSKNCRGDANIFLEDGRSLLNCVMQIVHDHDKDNFLEQKPDSSKDSWIEGENDSVCSVCLYGGELILCDQCPSSFHRICLGMRDIPTGDWFCPSCCCRICGQSKLKKDTESCINDEVLNCTQCQRKYHIGCIWPRRVDELECDPKQNWFCCKKCEQIFLGLQELLGKSIPVGVDNLTWKLVKSMQLDGDASTIEAYAESYSKLHIALDVMHECFEPVEEPHSRRDLVKDVIFSKGSELKRMNFQGFYTILLEKNDEIITVATVRVYGEKVAELPLVATRFQYRRLGMCRILMEVLEKKLMELGVQRLVLPAVPSVLNTWTSSFGFTKMSDSERLQFADYVFLDFQDTVMCYRLLTEIPFTELSPCKDIQPMVDNDICGSGDCIDLDGSGTTVSDIFQADQVEESGIVEQELMDFPEGSGSNDDKISINLVNKTTQPEYEPCVSEMSLPCLVDQESTLKKESNNHGNGTTTSNKDSHDNGNGIFKCYKRRRY